MILNRTPLQIALDLLIKRIFKNEAKSAVKINILQVLQGQNQIWRTESFATKMFAPSLSTRHPSTQI